MNPRLPTVSATQLIAILQRRGFVRIRQSGSHAVFRHADGRRTTVPVHHGRDIGRGLLRQIMRDADLSPDDFQ
jgi:predicted RNA binding protein YcfA (HicA-like mRNA interferase family)